MDAPMKRLGAFLITLLCATALAVPTAWGKAFEPNPDALPGATSSSESASAPDASTPDTSDASDEPSPEAYGDSASSAPDASTLAAPDAFVFDLYGALTPSEQDALEAKAREIADNYDMGAYVLITGTMDGLANPTPSQRTSFATSFYRLHDLGLGNGKDGIMLAVAIDSRDYVTIAYGQGSYAFSDKGIQVMEDDVTSYLGDDLWFEGAQAFYTQVSDQLAYYQRTGRAEEPTSLTAGGVATSIIAIVAVSALVAFFVVRRERRIMRNAQMRDDAREYVDRNSVQLTAATNDLVNTTMVVVPIPKSNHGSLGGGGWGGGGGGGFSSSGGGKF